jgi:ribonuclease BN (tRNA processing enzyme)
MIMHILGRSSVYPAKGEATSGYLLHGTFGYVLIDCGCLIADKVAAHCDLQHLSAVVISHMHPDHCDSLATLSTFIYKKHLTRLPVFLPPGGIRGSQQLHGVIACCNALTSCAKVIEYDPSQTLCLNELRITFKLTKHSINAYAMRFSESGNSRELVYTSDTGWFDGLAAFCQGAYLMLVEAGNYPLATISEEPERWHLTPEEAGQLIREAGVEQGVVTHYDSRYSEQILSMASRMCGLRNVVLAAECGEYSI